MPEFEALRIPSTKNLCIVARTRCSDTPASLPAAAEAGAKARAADLVKRYGRAWVARTPESDKTH